MKETAALFIDFTSVGVLLGWALQVLPGIATLLTVVWVGFRIWNANIERKIKVEQLKQVKGE